jgi:hypothetical protein
LVGYSFKMKPISGSKQTPAMWNSGKGTSAAPG